MYQVIVKNLEDGKEFVIEHPQMEVVTGEIAPVSGEEAVRYCIGVTGVDAKKDLEALFRGFVAYKRQQAWEAQR